MKKFYTTLAMVLTVAIASFAQLIPLGKSVPYAGIRRNTIKLTDENVLVTPPETAVIEDDWAIDAIYYYGENNIPYVNDNAISVAFDGEDVYFKGVVLSCPNAWIKGKLRDYVATFNSGQYCGENSDYSIYACGSSSTITLMISPLPLPTSM